ncbi:uncharacterized protein SCHCODRAFT_02639495 [Schizophyllum commune H4-8]|uniref:uncharacterized protein n=1 Tax=Schizophyllum commune (strain H4-8 / FGSC 9210) TaxID=578458 RepID=UPI00216003E8|nr:uncharacterized protein SCHCODRAFT_02639495 [Schizophyllum commune H4-8]KAI5888012.1 hypothetical protein SCHCODRAFT_02639495 [Schizophyllum commune H4-8]
MRPACPRMPHPAHRIRAKAQGINMRYSKHAEIRVVALCLRMNSSPMAIRMGSEANWLPSHKRAMCPVCEMSACTQADLQRRAVDARHPSREGLLPVDPVIDVAAISMSGVSSSGRH